jgi:hypothetical protein
MSFIKVLMVAEKPSIAEVLARSLSGGRSFKGDSRIPSHEYRGTFMGQDAAFTVTSVMGHVFRRVVQPSPLIILELISCSQHRLRAKMESQLGRDQPRRPVSHAPHLPTSLISRKLSCSYSASVVSTEANAKARVVDHLSHSGKSLAVPTAITRILRVRMCLAS